MTCIYDAAVEVSKKYDNASWPKTVKFKKIRELLLDDWMPCDKQAKIICIWLREYTRKYPWMNESTFSFVFLHPNKKAKTDFDCLAHCLGLYKARNELHRFCSFENNWRFVYSQFNSEFRFNTRDWTTSMADTFVDKPFRFSYFITRTGYSIWVPPSTVISKLEKNSQIGNDYNYNHDFKYKLSWEKLI